VERRVHADSTTRALSLWAKAADILDECGITREAILERSVPIRRLTYLDEHRHLASFRLPEAASCRTLPQQETENLLAARLRALGGEVERGMTFEAVEVNEVELGVAVRVSDAAGRTDLVEADYLVGADGAQSAVRKALGLGFDGETFERSFAVVDAHIDGYLPDDECLFYQTAQGPLVIVPIGGGVFRFLTMRPEEASDTGFMQHVVDTRGPTGVRLGKVVSEAVFRVHTREADSYRVRNSFLVGDAAHVHSPAGGQGMNNGLHDAHNLGWKLSAVLQGRARVTLLDTYDPERRQATRRIMADTNRQTSLWVLKNRVLVAGRNALFRLADKSGLATRWYAPVMAGHRVRYAVTRASQLPRSRAGCLRGRRLVGRSVPGLPRQGSTEAVGWQLWSHATDAGSRLTGQLENAARHGTLPVTLRGAIPADVRMGCRRPGYFLVRPDGYIQAHGHAADLGQLRAELSVW
jgi:3-(3-hydroxy-phenyl)propionate hydroxylase